MGSEIQPIPPDADQTQEPYTPPPQSDPIIRLPEPEDDPFKRLMKFLTWVLIGDQGLRAGWSLALFISLFFILANGVRFALRWAHLRLPSGSGPLTPKGAFVGELIQLILLVFVAWIVSRIERRRLTDYNLRGPRPWTRFGAGLVTGFLAISVLVGGLSAGGWMHFGPVALSGGQILLYAVAWGVTFLLVGCLEEGLARCYLLYTLARGLNFWWGLGLVGCICLLVSLNAKANGLWGAYGIAILGLIPCLILQLRKAPGVGFWSAAWVTSVMFGAGHTSNSGENWVGIFAAAGIGLVFCASVRLTGSALWAIGCHASWDWGESYFYGTPDSGLVAQGHLLTTTQAGDALWTGGAVGPEGSLLIIPVILLLLLVLVVQYGRKRQALAPTVSEQPVAG